MDDNISEVTNKENIEWFCIRLQLYISQNRRVGRVDYHQHKGLVWKLLVFIYCLKGIQCLKKSGMRLWIFVLLDWFKVIKKEKDQKGKLKTCVFSVVNALALPNTSETLLITRKHESQNAKLHFWRKIFKFRQQSAIISSIFAFNDFFAPRFKHSEASFSISASYMDCMTSKIR